MYLINTPKWLARLFRGVLFQGPSHDDMGRPILYLTFDDGPTPGVTNTVLDILERHGARSTFFCLGAQVEAHPKLAERITAEGHTLGNHGYHHFDAYNLSKNDYITNIERGAKFTSQTLFRPPYGRLTWSLYRRLRKTYRIVLFSLMPGDFKEGVSAADVVQRVKKGAVPGSIVVLHDNYKVGIKLLEALPEILNWAKEAGFACRALKG